MCVPLGFSSSMPSTRGTGTRRSKACWTCKLRRKKCDANRPVCEACSSRSITCHGYGGWPEWMDGGDKEHAELERIQKTVKENKKRVRKEKLESQAQTQRNSQPSSDVADGENHGDTISTQQNDWPFDVTPVLPGPELNSPFQEPAELITIDTSVESMGEMVSSTPTPNLPSYFHNHREAELLMHYLDHVFSLQFRFHSPSASHGGRGWLLWLLTETKPLYHAALSLGALHQHSLLTRSARGQRYHDTLNELNEHHNRALQELQIFLQSSYNDPGTADLNRKRKLRILACGVQLISFELFRGGTSQWQVHLDALATIVSSIQQAREPPSQPSLSIHDEHPSGMLTPEVGPDNQSHNLEDTAEQFLIGAVLWFDIASCASTNKRPRLFHDYDTLLHGQLDLENIVGCQPWIAILIGEIATLNAWKMEASLTNSLSVWELFEKGNPIRRKLVAEIARLRAEIDDAFHKIVLPHLSSNAVYLVMSNPSLHAVAVRRGVTLVFAYAAQVYLNTTISGAYPSLDEVRTSVSDTAKALQELRIICDLQTLRSLIWPICIAGCMAEDASMQSFFRGLIQDLGDEAHDFGNSATALCVMEKCWTCRNEGVTWVEGKGWDWFAVMESMGQRVLLV